MGRGGGGDPPVVLRCLGTGDAFGSGGRLQAGFLVECGDARIALDFGATSLPSLRQLGVPPESIDAICVSHFHGDHYGGIPFLIRYRFLRSIDRPLTIVGPTGLSDRLDRALDAFFPPARRGDAAASAELVELLPGASTAVHGAQVSAYAASHRTETEPLALRLTIGGVTIGYSGDSAWTDGVEAAARDADLFIVEAYQQTRNPAHMSVVELRERLPGLGCRRVLLTHLGPEVLAAPPDLPGCVIARDHLELVVGSEEPYEPPETSSATLRIGEVAALTGKTVHTLRYYESIGVLPEVPRRNGIRAYGPLHVEWLQFMDRLKATGMRLADIKRYAALLERKDVTVPERRALLAEHRRDLLAKLDRDAGFLAELDAKIRWLERGRSLSARGTAGRVAPE